MSILITGAQGFIGQALTHKLTQNHRNYLSITRSNFGEITASSDWSKSLHNINTIIHLAARVHQVSSPSVDSLAVYRAANTVSTLNLAQQAAASGVQRFIFLSTIKVNGEESKTPYTEKSTPKPQDPYAQSKWEAEEGLKRIGTKTGMEIIIIRPPLVYGPHVKANFLRLLQWVDKGIPLPIASINNKRSLVYVGNLVDLIIRCIEHPNAANQTLLVSDGEDLSTPDLINRLSKHFNKKSRLFYFSPTLLQTALRLIGKESDAQKLLGSLTLDPTFAYQTLDWIPPFTVDEGLAETVKSYKYSKCFF